MALQDLLNFVQHPYILAIVRILVVFMGLSLIVAYIVFAERKVLAHLQARLGPMRVGPHGLLQPIADGIKLLIKEDIVPHGADKFLFLLAPVISVMAAFVAFSLIPFSGGFVITDVNVGLLFVLAISSTGVLGIILGGWASNSHYPLLGALRATAQVVSFEVALGFAIISALLLSGTLSMQGIVAAQRDSGVWFVFWQPVAFFILFVAAVAETNRNPFDLPEAESELVAGFHTEYSGFRFSLFFLAEYAAMVLVSSVAVTLFLGGWLRPFQSVEQLQFLELIPAAVFILAAYWAFRHVLKMPRSPEWFYQRSILAAMGAGAAGIAVGLFALAELNRGLYAEVEGVFWFLSKTFLLLYGFIWIRGTFPRYRFDQLMNLGWRFMIPVAMANVIFCGVGLILAREYGWNQWAGLWAANAATLLVAIPFAGRRG